MAAPLPLTPSTDDWPRYGDGGIDWETVFETPGTGLIAQLRKAPDAAGLRRAARMIVRQLFKRREDAAVRYRYLARVDAFTGDDPESPGAAAPALEEIIDDVAGLLRAVKVHRIEAAGLADDGEGRRGPPAFPGLDR